LLSSPSRERPQLVYLSTVTQHFRTESGEHDPSQHQRLKALECQPTVKANRRMDEERHSLHETVHVDRFLNYDTIDTGDFHIGGGDCTHYCMPGPPDVTAEKLVQTWLKNQSFIDNNL
jgi:molybdopterin-biosynthesis enzyme MoeA-like protein